MGLLTKVSKEKQVCIWVKLTSSRPDYFSQFHRLLKDLDAPVYYVQDWGKDLPELLKNLTDEELQRKQDELKVWHAKFVRHLRLLLFKLIRTHFEPEDDDYN